MCGIAGFLSHKEKVRGETVAPLLKLLHHRGPDDFGWFYSNGQEARVGKEDLTDIEADVFLLHRRLSILDVTSAGWQPMATPDERYYIVFNGEIYNFLELRQELESLGQAFQSSSDTEVLLKAFQVWGPQVLPRLIGMFAFAILDRQNRQLYLARDGFGIKPLYCSVLPNGLAFASEINALLQFDSLKRTVNAQRVYDYLYYGCTDHGEETMFADIRQLPSGHYAKISLAHPNRVDPVCYWKPKTGQLADLSLEEAASKLRELFIDSVKLHLRSDVPIGSCLSGGIDSSAIVNVMRHIQPNLDLHTFSYIAEDKPINEEPWIDEVNRATNATAHKVSLGSTDLVSELEQLIALQDEPFGSTSIYAQYRVFQQAKETGVTVMLDGQGADELLAGYRHFFAGRLATLIRQGQWQNAWQFLRNASQLQGGSRLRMLVQTGRLMAPGMTNIVRKAAGKGSFPSWLNKTWFRTRPISLFLLKLDYSSEVLREQLRKSILETSLPMLLRFEDRNSMIWSIESRVPFLTIPLMEFIQQLPEEYLLAPDATSKNVFRLAMRGLVPDSVLDRRDKIGFQTPENRWLTTLRPWVEQTLNSDVARSIPALDHRGMLQDWQAILNKKSAFDFRVWRWVNLIRWAERFHVKFPD